MDNDITFNTHADIWKYLLLGEKITDKNPHDMTTISLVDGVPMYSTGRSAKNCLFTPSYWQKAINNNEVQTVD